MTNIRFAIYKLEKPSGAQIRPGGQVVSIVSSNVEGFIFDARGKELRMINGVPSLVDKPVSFKIHVDRKSVYASEAVVKFWNNLDYIEDGYYVDITHYRHPITKSFVPYATQDIKRYQIGYVERLSPLDDNYTFSLKIRDK